MHFVRKVEHVSGHTLRLTFEDGSVRSVDLGPYLDGDIFDPLKDPEYFRTVALNTDIDTVVWDNGADFSPDFLYGIGHEVAREASAG